MTLSAGRLRASRLSGGSLLVAGPDGAVGERPGLSVHRDVLSSPGLRVGRLEGDLDVKGNTLS